MIKSNTTDTLRTQRKRERERERERESRKIGLLGIENICSRLIEQIGIKMALIIKNFLIIVRTCEMSLVLIPKFCKIKKTVKTFLNNEQIQI